MRTPLILWMCLLITCITGCSIKKVAVNKVGDALAAGGTTFAADDDPELVKAAVPFSLKLMESLLVESPKHEGLLVACAAGFTQYSYVFVQQEAEERADTDVEAAQVMLARARRLYLRARDYALTVLEIRHPGITNELRADAVTACRRLKKRDVPAIYWTAAAWGAATGVIKNNTDLISELPIIGALADRALELDESYDFGAIHAFLITYATIRPPGVEPPESVARRHFQRAVALTQGQQAGPFVSLAENVAVPEQNRKEFEDLLKRALSINPEGKPEWRLANLVMQKRARWLLQRENALIGEPEK